MSRIVIVEDNEVIAKNIKSIVINIDEKHIVETTGYAGTALKTAGESIVDLFILDIQLLDYSGLELAKQIRDIEKYKFTPIIFVTSMVNNELKAFREIHCYAYLVKPFNSEKTRTMISEILTYGIKNEAEEATLLIDQKEFSTVIKQKDIVYIEKFKKRVTIYMEKDEIEASGFTLVSLQKILSSNFVQCHKSIIVNKYFIKRINKSEHIIELNSSKYSKLPYGDLFRAALEVGK